MTPAPLEGFFNIPYGPSLWHAVASYPHELVNKFNTLRRVSELRCNWSWRLFVETALPAAGQLVLALLDFGLDDVVRGYLRPFGPRARARLNRKAKKPGKKNLKKFEIPELGELIGENLPGARLFKARHVSKAERFIWVLDGLAQRALYYWMIFDLTTDFFYNWAVGIYKSELCAAGSAGGRVQRSGHTTGAYWDAWVTAAHNPLTLEYSNIWGAPLGDEATGIGNDFRPVQYICALKVDRSFGAAGWNWEARIVSTRTGYVYDHQDGLWPGDEAIVITTIGAGDRAVCQFKVNSGGQYVMWNYDLDSQAFIV